MKTLSIQDGDLYTDSNGNLAVASDIEGLRQRIEEYLKTIRGEWALDLTRGLPYMEQIFVYGATEQELRRVFDSGIREFSEVVSVVNSVSVIDSKSRKYYYGASVYTVYGETEITING
jgi:hypothetical protein